MVNGLKNVICEVDEQSTLHVVRGPSTSYWRFDEEENMMEHVQSSGTNWATQIVEGCGIPYTTGSGSYAQNITKEDIVKRLNPQG